MGVTLVKPIPGDVSTSGTWGTTINNALDALNADQFKIKTADQSITSSTTLTDDTHLASMTLGIGTWRIEAVFLASGAAAGDVKIAWAFAGTTTQATRSGRGPATTATSALDSANSRMAAAGDTAATITASTPYGTDGTNWSAISEHGVLVVSVSGVFKIQWAQNTSSGTATIMRAGSYVIARQVA